MAEDGRRERQANHLKRTSELLREARAVQRRLDALEALARADQDPCLERVVGARAAVEQLVVELSFRRGGEQRRLRARERRPAGAGPA